MSRTPQTPLHAMNPLGRFSDRAEGYAKHRPSYPREAIDAVLRGLGEPSGLCAADIGAGTGISARLLADCGVRVIAVEPNAEMRLAAEPHPRVRFVDGAAERTGLEDASVDLVVCAQAFHWFKAGDALAEFARVIRRAGRVALVWNVRDQADAYTRRYTDLVREAAGCDIAVDRMQVPVELGESALFKGFREEQFRYEQVLDEGGLVGRAESASYVPRSGPAHERLVVGLRGLHESRADGRGMAALVYATRVFLAERR